MGTWDAGPFDNDNAADFAGDLDDLPPAGRPPLIRQALETAIREEGDLDGRLGAVAVAAAALVASQCPDGEPADPVYGPEEPLPALPVELRALAVQALDRVTGPGSDLPGLWGEAEDAAEWRSGIVRLRAVLFAGGTSGRSEA